MTEQQMKLKKDFDKIMSVNRMQHHYIQNLQKANMELKNRVKAAETAVPVLAAQPSTMNSPPASMMPQSTLPPTTGGCLGGISFGQNPFEARPRMMTERELVRPAFMPENP